MVEGTGQPDQDGGAGLLSQCSQSAEDGVGSVAFTAPERVRDGQPNAMLVGHVPNGGLGNPVEGLRVDPQADCIDRSDNLVGFKEESAEQLLPNCTGEAPSVRLGRQPDGVDERGDPTQPIEMALPVRR